MLASVFMFSSFVKTQKQTLRHVSVRGMSAFPWRRVFICTSPHRCHRVVTSMSLSDCHWPVCLHMPGLRNACEISSVLQRHTSHTQRCDPLNPRGDPPGPQACDVSVSMTPAQMLNMCTKTGSKPFSWKSQSHIPTRLITSLHNNTCLSQICCIHPK